MTKPREIAADARRPNGRGPRSRRHSQIQGRQTTRPGSTAASRPPKVGTANDHHGHNNANSVNLRHKGSKDKGERQGDQHVINLCLLVEWPLAREMET